MHAPNPAQAAPFAYITNFEGRSISVIDVATNSVVMTIDEVAPRKPGCVAISPDGSTVYVVTTYNDFGAVDVFDAATNTCTDILDVGFRPNDVAVSPDGSRLYATGFYSSSVAVVDTATGGVIERVSVGKGHFGIAVHPDGARVYAADGDSGVVSVFDTSTNTEIADIDVDGGATNDVVVHPDGTRAYSANSGPDTVSVIDTASNSEIMAIDVGRTPVNLAINPAGTRLYVSNYDDDTVTVIDTANNTAVTTITVGNGPRGISTTPSGTRAFVACFGQDIVSVIDTATNTVINNIIVGDAPFAPGRFITPAAQMAATPDYHHFGSVNAGAASAPHQFTVSNQGTASLEIRAVAASGDDALEFEIVTNGCTSGLVLAPLATCGISARFVPTSGGTKRASIRIAYEAPAMEAYHIDLVGTGVGPTPTVIDPAPPIDDLDLDFGGVEANQTSDATITIRNDGNANLAIATIASADPLADPFSLVAGQDNCSNQTLTPAELCDFTVRFAPTTSVAGLFDTFDIPTNAQQAITFNLQGQGLPDPFVDIHTWDEIQPANDYLVPLGDELVGETTWPVYIRSHNRGSTDALVIESIVITGPDAGEFAMVMVEDEFWEGYCGPTPPFPVKPFPGLCNMYTTFSPTSAGEKIATVEIVSNDPEESLIFYTLTGRGMGPEIEVTDSMDPPDDLLVLFGEVTEGQSSYAEITITNTGTTDLNVADIAFLGDPDFTLDPTAGPISCETLSLHLSPGHGCTLAVSFTPSSLAEKTANVTITSTDPDELSSVVTLTGTGVPSEEPDSGTPDAQDAGAQTDDATPDAGGDESDSGDGNGSDGCGCHTGTSPATLIACLLLLSALVLRRRRYNTAGKVQPPGHEKPL